MSLVNQMLKDLEKRRAPEMGGEAVLRDLAVGAPRGGNGQARHPLLLAGGAIILAAVAAVGYWQLQSGATAEASPQPALLPAPSAASKPAEPAPRRADAAPSPAAPLPDEQPEVAVAIATLEEPASSAPEPKPVAASSEPAVAAIAAKQRLPTAPAPGQASQPQPVRSEPQPSDQRIRPAAVMERVARPQSPREQARVMYLKGVELVRRGRLGEAQTQLRAALGRDAELVEAREVLAAVLLRAQRGAEAEQVLTAGLARDKGAYSLARLYARILAERNATQAAIATLETSLPAPALDPEYYGLLAALYQRADLHDKAAEAYRRVLPVAPERGAWWTGLGISLERLNRTSDALQAYRRARGASSLAPQLVSFVDGRVAALEEGRGKGQR